MTRTPLLREPPAPNPLDPGLTDQAPIDDATPRPDLGVAQRGSMFAALSVRNYRIYLGGSAVSNVGTWMQRVAQDWLVLELSGGSGLAVGITTALQFVPTLLFSAYGGVIADRFDKRLVLKITQSWMALCAAALGILAITGVAVTGHVYVLAFAFGLGSAFDVPARQSFVSEVVGRDRIANAIGLNSATFHGARIVGPAVAGLVIATFGSGWAILSNAVTYLAFLAALVIIDGRQLHLTERTAPAKRQIRAGIAYVRSRPDILLVLGVVFFVGTFGMNFQMTSALMAQQQFHRGAADYGILGTFMAVGSLGGALLAARRRHAPRARFIVTMAVAFGLIEIVAGLMPTYGTYAAVLPLLGLAALLTMTASNACIQMGVDPQLRGRVMALYATLLMGGTPIGAPILGWVGQTFGARWTLIGGGALTALGALTVAILLANKLDLHLTPVRRPHPHLELQRR
ncbi:MAG: MFS transporter [Propionibacteriaceae bacterium]